MGSPISWLTKTTIIIIIIIINHHQPSDPEGPQPVLRPFRCNTLGRSVWRVPGDGSENGGVHR